MKKILLALALTLVSTSAYADACATGYMPAFPAAMADRLCRNTNGPASKTTGGNVAINSGTAASNKVDINLNAASGGQFNINDRTATQLLTVTESNGNIAQSKGTATLTGLNTVNFQAKSTSYEAVAGAGTVQGDAAALGSSATVFVSQLTGANGTVGWILPATTTVGTIRFFLNTTAGVAKIYPATGGTINGAAANAAFSALTGIKPIICITTAANTWICS